LAVWIDDQSGFGTFPLEAMECNTPVIGKMPNMVPEWMETEESNGEISVKNNGVWTNTTTNIPELIATYLKIWLEDAVPSDLLDGMTESKGQYTVENQKNSINEVYGAIFENRASELKITLEKLEDTLKEKENA
jgi:glycosyltransferase involved in cell wall biosynthesis